MFNYITYSPLYLLMPLPNETEKWGEWTRSSRAISDLRIETSAVKQGLCVWKSTNNDFYAMVIPSEGVYRGSEASYKHLEVETLIIFLFLNYRFWTNLPLVRNTRKPQFGPLTGCVCCGCPVQRCLSQALRMGWWNRYTMASSTTSVWRRHPLASQSWWFQLFYRLGLEFNLF